MNEFLMDLSRSANTNFTTGDLKLIGLMMIFGNGFRLVPNTSSQSLSMQFSLPFSNSNVSSGSVAQQLTVYDTTAQGVNEYSDRPFPVKGYLAVIQEYGANIGVSDSDFDNFIRIPCVKNTGATPAPGFIKIGLCNSGLSDYYTPFASADVKVFFQLPNTAVLGQEAVFSQAQLPVDNVFSASTPTLKLSR